jgi:hypothetical protein
MPQKPDNQKSSPRFKRRKGKSTKGPQIINYSLSDTSRLSKKIPAAVKIAIANVIMAFAEMEVSAETVIWDLTGLSPDDGKLLTRMDSKDKLELTKKFSERYGLAIHPDSETAANIWSVIRQEVEARNKIAHGMWVMIDKKIPLAISYRIPTSLGRITGEQFPIDRLRLIADNC